jgi:hypothetical protein
LAAKGGSVAGGEGADALEVPFETVNVLMGTFETVI